MKKMLEQAYLEIQARGISEDPGDINGSLSNPLITLMTGTIRLLHRSRLLNDGRHLFIGFEQ